MEKEMNVYGLFTNCNGVEGRGKDSKGLFLGFGEF